MIGRILALAAALALAACGGKAGGEPERDWPEPSPALWEVSGLEGQRGWLFGTIHALPDDVEWRTPEIGRALDAAGVLVVEVAELGDGRQARAAFSERAQIAGLPPLSRRISAGDRPALAALIAREGLSEDDFAGIETWAAALMLANAVRAHDPANGVDRALLASGKPAIGLETLGEQYDRFDRLAPADQADLLAGVIEEAGAGGHDARVEAWLTGDMEALEREAASGILAYPRLRDALLDARNREWAGRIDALLREGRAPFVAVGAAHMLEPGGLPALLAERGWQVRRVRDGP